MFFVLPTVAQLLMFYFKTLNGKDAMSQLWVFFFFLVPTFHCNKAFVCLKKRKENLLFASKWSGRIKHCLLMWQPLYHSGEDTLLQLTTSAERRATDKLDIWRTFEQLPPTCARPEVSPFGPFFSPFIIFNECKTSSFISWTMTWFLFWSDSCSIILCK